MNDVVSSSVLNSMNESLPLIVKLVVTRQPGQPLWTLEERVPPKRSMVSVAVETWVTHASNTYLNRESWKRKWLWVIIECTCYNHDNYPTYISFSIAQCINTWSALGRGCSFTLALLCGSPVKLIMTTSVNISYSTVTRRSSGMAHAWLLSKQMILQLLSANFQHKFPQNQSQLSLLIDYKACSAKLCHTLLFKFHIQETHNTNVGLQQRIDLELHISLVCWVSYLT